MVILLEKYVNVSSPVCSVGDLEMAIQRRTDDNHATVTQLYT